MMELTEAQKKFSTSQKFWKMMEKGKQSVEYTQKHPVSTEEAVEQQKRLDKALGIKNRFLKDSK